eukprot:CAMPEP_0196779596 /NCGR_PEP_ID=MMETSP1104-20130614/6474_1 /TAXON_ID=33652 /ORGANISM="Cafeteria sp., Strain Caron Lab Isolate" /LENGTH=586 /DNA_ID=CAMNT_0042149781 /DNA_START=126 /DNA_END=1886 /DNA_ORIENTATION=-
MSSKSASEFSAKTIEVEAANVRYTKDAIVSEYRYETTEVVEESERLVARPVEKTFTFKTERRVPKLGVMIVGWGGNNGTTVTAGILANKHNITWRTREGVQHPNYLGSVTQASTIRLGTSAASGRDLYVPFNKVLPMVHPNDIVLGGWDISSLNLGAAMERAEVLEYDLQRQLRPMMDSIVPLPSIYRKDFIASNQEARADNVLTGTVREQMEQVRAHIRDFKAANGVDKVIVLWSANTERFASILEGVNDSAAALLAAIDAGHEEVSPSTLFAVASILEGCSYINGSPQNTFVPGVVEMATERGVFIGGDDFKSGQTKFKSVMVDFLVSAGIKPEAISSYNHLGNNDGKNLSEARQFRSKEISKSTVVDDMVGSNRILYGAEEAPDHCVVIKYIPAVGDSKRALDEYSSRIFLNGRNTISSYNVCEDSLLASPLIIDLVLLTELCERIRIRRGAMDEAATVASDSKEEEAAGYERFHSVLSLLSYLLKAPMVPPGTPVVNALFKQREAIVNVMRACIGLPAENHMSLEHRLASAGVSVAEYAKVMMTEQAGAAGAVEAAPHTEKAAEAAAVVAKAAEDVAAVEVA